MVLHFAIGGRPGVAVRGSRRGEVPLGLEGSCDRLSKEIAQDPGILAGGDSSPELRDREIVISAGKGDASEVVQGVHGRTSTRMPAGVFLQGLLHGRQLRRVRGGRGLQERLRPVQHRPQVPGGFVLIPLKVRAGPQRERDDDDDAAGDAPAEENVDGADDEGAATADEGDEGDDEGDDEGSVEVDNLDDLPDECVDAIGDMLEKIEPLVEDIDWENASLAEMESLGEELTSDDFEIDEELEELPGVEESHTSYAKQVTKVVFDDAEIELPTLLETIEELGYRASERA